MGQTEMKGKLNSRIRKRVIAYCLAGIMSVSLLAVPSVKADAAASKKSMNLVNTTNPTGSVTGGGVDHIYFGTYSQTTNNFDGRFRVLDSSKTNTGAKGMFLLSENALGEANGTGAGDIIFRPTGSKAYSGSNVQSWCTSFYNSTFSSIEKNAILATTKGDASYEGRSGVKSETAEGVLNGDKVFLPSYEEVYNSSYGFDSDASRKISFMKVDGTEMPVNWWTRSPYTANNNCLMVNTSGKATYKSVNNGLCVRPAFNLNTSNVIFTSAATGGKSSGSVGSNALSAVNSYSGTDWKLTLKDSNRSNFNASFVSVNNDVVTVNYSGASYGSNEYVSAIIVNSSGDIKYYGRIKQFSSSGSASGQITVNTSGKLANTDKFYVFSEQCNGDKKTDYASALKEISVVIPINISMTVNAAVSGNTIVVSWNSVSQAERYRLFRKTSGSDWQALTATNATTYTDKNLVSGTTYYYGVRCISSDGEYLNELEDGKGVYFNASQSVVPNYSLTYIDNTGVKITWSKIDGVAYYRLFRQGPGETSFKGISKLTGTEYTDKTVDFGKTYKYYVRCIDSNGSYVGSFNSSGQSITVPAALQADFSLENVNGGVKISWKSVSGAASYRIFRKGPGESTFTALSKVATTSYTDKKAEAGKTYYYYVRCIDANGKYVGTYNANGQSITVPETKKAEITLSNVETGVKISWQYVDGVASYRIFRKGPGETTFTGISKTTGNQYTDKNVAEGKTYYYYVRCIDANGKYIGTFDANGKSIDVPVKVRADFDLSITSDGVRICWNAVDGAASYRIFRKAEDEDTFKGIVKTSATEYIDKNVEGEKHYSYYVRCIDSNGKYIGAYEENGIMIMVPVLLKVDVFFENQDNGILVYWDAIDPSLTYRVFRKGPGESSFTGVKKTTGSEYLDKTVEKNKTYYYYVRCIGPDGKYIGTYDAKGKRIDYR